MENFSHFGVMFDCSRNAVLSIESFKRMVSCLKKMGYNTALLYLEDTYEIEGEPYFGYLRGRYSKNELKEMDAYASGLGIELIPCIQTLAHLNGMVRWACYNEIVDAIDTLLVDNEKTYQLIDKMFKTCAECFKTRKINIGMDEAFALGRGKHLQLHGYEESINIYLRHLKKVANIASNYGFEPAIWSDMVYSALTKEGYYNLEIGNPESIKKEIPDNVSLIYWDYYHEEKDFFSKMIDNHKTLGRSLVFAGGIWTWSGFTPQNDYALRTILPSIEACKEGGVKDYFLTAWKDNGGECSFFACLPSLFYASEVAKGIVSLETIKEDFFTTFGVKWDDFDLFNLPNIIGTTKDKKNYENPSKYLFYNDPLLGICDLAVSKGDSKLYQEHAAALFEALPRLGEYGYLARYYGRLCEFLALKNSLGVELRNSYQSGNREKLIEIKSSLTNLYGALDAFLIAFREAYYYENKPHGFDVQVIRIGGLKARLEETERRLNEYLNGEITSIPELEETILDANGESGEKSDGKAKVLNNWAFNASVNSL